MNSETQTKTMQCEDCGAWFEWDATMYQKCSACLWAAEEPDTSAATQARGES